MADGYGDVVTGENLVPGGPGIDVPRFELLKNAGCTQSELNAFQPGISDGRSDCLAGRAHGRSHAAKAAGTVLALTAPAADADCP